MRRKSRYPWTKDGGQVTPDVTAAIKRRIVIGQSLYAFGALLCIFNTHWSITFIVLVQLNYAIAPRIRRARHMGAIVES
jgi:hypothetical protein